MTAELFSLKDNVLYEKNIKKAAKALLRGVIVAFPTETVYGIGVNADDGTAIDSLYRLKQRPRDKKLAVIINEADDIIKYVKDMPQIARKLMDSFWPGPLTIVFTLPDNDTIGFRNSANHVVRDLIKCAGVPIVSTSANISGRPPATDAQQVKVDLDDSVGVILDGGPTRSEIPSTVVRIKGETFEIIRHGIINEERIYRCINK